MNQLITKEILDRLSYESILAVSLKQISLRKTDLDKIYEDIRRWRSHQMEILINERLIGMRFKSDDSIMRKYNKTLANEGGFKQCFNDVLGFRIHLDKYPEKYPEYFRVVDLRNGKKEDDGYKAVHLYYQRDSYSYPIEIQLWCEEDYLYNVWSHKHTYKYKCADIGKTMRQYYDDGEIKSEPEFLLKLEEVEVSRG